MLNHKITVYVPVIEPLKKTREMGNYTAKIATELAGLFGECTVTKSNGYWVDDTGNLIEDKINLCYSFTDSKTLEANRLKVREICETMKEELQQIEVSLEIDNILMFI